MRVCTPKLSLPLQYPFFLRSSCSCQRHKPKHQHYNANIYLVLWWAYSFFSLMNGTHHFKTKYILYKHMLTHSRKLALKTNSTVNLLFTWKRLYAMKFFSFRLLRIFQKGICSLLIHFLIFKFSGITICAERRA